LQDRRIAKTKTAIQNAFVSIILEQDTPKITVTEIARRANIDRKTFYLHYKSTDDIIYEFTGERNNELTAILEKNNFFTRDFDVSLLFSSFNLLLNRDIKLYRHLAKNNEYSFFWNKLGETIKNTFIEVYKDKLDIQTNELSLCAEYYFAGIMATYLKWLRDETDMSEEELGKFVGDIAYYGFKKLLSEKQCH